MRTLAYSQSYAYGVRMSIDHHALRVLMEKDGSTPTNLAARVGISPQYMSGILGGERTLKRSPGLIKKLAEALNVPTSMLERRAPGE